MTQQYRRLNSLYGTYLERSAPTEEQGGFTQYARFTPSDATDGSSNRNYLLQESTELSTLWMMLGVFCSGYRSRTRLYTVIKLMNQL